MTDTIMADVWSDLVCPWCYIGKRRLEEGIARYHAMFSDHPVEVVFHSFQLDPDAPDDYEGHAAEHLAMRKGIDPQTARAMQRRVAHVASTVGLDYDFDRLKPANTALAHQLLHLAAEHGAQAETKERLFRAHFTEGRHIGKIDELVEIADEAGLDPEEAGGALETGRFADTVLADRMLATRIGIQGVPFFVFDGRVGVSGAQPPETIVEALQRASEPAA